MKQETDLAEKLFGNKRLETGSEKLTTTTIIAKALTDSENGYVEVEYDGNITYGDFQKNIVPTGPNVKAGDTVLITAAGGVGKTMSVTNVQGWGDRMASEPIDGVRIVNGTLLNSHFQDGTIDGSKITNSSISGSKIESSTIEGSNINFSTFNDGVINGSVINTSTFRDGTISGSVIDTSTFVDGTISGSKIDTSTFTNGSISGSAIDSSTFTNGSISGSAIDTSTFTNGSISGSAIDTSTFTNGSIDGSKITDSTISGSKIDTSTFTDGSISGSVIDTSTFVAGSIYGSAIDSSTLTNIPYAGIRDADINVARVADAQIASATITQGQIENLEADYAKVSFENVTNSWVENGVIRNGAIQNEMVQNVSASKLTAGTIDASKINVANLSADNLIVRRINGQPVVGGYTLIGTTSPGYSSKNPSQEGWYELSNGAFVLTQDTSVQEGKPYYQEGDEVALYDQTYIDNMKNQLNQRIDGAVETFTGTVVPTLTNYPYNTWYDTSLTPPKDERASHVGDIYFVVNPALDQDGYSYRFAYDNTSMSYMWVLIKDSDVTKALSDITDLQDFESETVSWKEETDEGLTVIRQNHTALSGVVQANDENLLLDWNAGSTTKVDAPYNRSWSDFGNTMITCSFVGLQNPPKQGIKYAARFVCDGTQTAAKARGLRFYSSSGNLIPLTNGQTYTATWWARCTTGSGKSCLCWTKNSGFDYSERTTLTSSWQQLTATFSTEISSNGSVYFMAEFPANTSGTVELCGFRLVAGESAESVHDTFIDFEQNTFKELVDTVDEQSSTITQITNRAETLANPNLVPWFAMSKDNVYDSETNPNGYWARIAINSQFTTCDMCVDHNGSGGWAHFAGNVTSGNPYVRFEPMPISLKPSTEYTFVLEIDGTFASTLTDVVWRLSERTETDAFDMFDARAEVVAPDSMTTGVYYATATTKSNFSDSVTLARAYVQLFGTGEFDVYARISLYEGVYEGPYKPYVPISEYVETTNVVNQVKQTADANTAVISGISTVVSNNGLTENTNITSRASRIEQTLEGFSSTVSAVIDENTVGSNILTGNALNPYSWTVSAPSGANFTKTAYGTTGVKVTFDTVSGFELLTSPAITVQSGKDYTLSVKYTVGKDYAVPSNADGFGLSVYSASPTSAMDHNVASYLGKAMFFTTETAVTMGATITFKATSNTVYLRLNGAQIADGQTGLEFTLDKLVLVENIESRLTQAESSITQTATSIESLVNMADDYTAPDGTVKQNLVKNYITQRENAINLGVSQTYTTKEDFNKLEIGGRNLIIGTADYFAWGLDDNSYGNARPYGNVMTISGSGNTANRYLSARGWGSIPIAEMGDSLVLSFEVKSDDWSAVAEPSNYTGFGAFGVQFNTTDSPLYTEAPVGKAYRLIRLNNTSFFDVPELANGEWLKFVSKPFEMNTAFFTGDASKGVGRNLRLSFQLRCNGVVSFRNVKLEKGTKATDWSEAPEDARAYANQITSANLLRWTAKPQYTDSTSIPADLDDSTGWARWNANFSVERTDDGIKGTCASGNTTLTGFLIPLVSENAVVGGQDYTLSFDYKTNLTSLGPIYLLNRSGGNTSYSTAIAITASTSNWAHFKATLNWPSTAGKTTYAVLLPYVSSGWIEIKDGSMKLEKGSVATEWSEAGKDTTLRVTKTEADISIHDDQIALRATKEETYQYSRPNLIPFFEMEMSSIYHSVDNPTGYWYGANGNPSSVSPTWISCWNEIGEGWAHIEATNSGSSTVGYYAASNVSDNAFIKTGEKYTILTEMRNCTGNPANIYASTGASDTRFTGSANQKSKFSAGEYAHYDILTARDADTSTNPSRPFNFRIQVAAGESFSCDVRVSLYEGEYEGPYKPYSGRTLYASQAELKVASDEIDLCVKDSDLTGNDVIGRINLNSTTATIAAARVEIDGTAVFNALGSDKKVVTSSTPQWYSSISQSSPTGGSWATTQPSVEDGRYIWQRTYYTYSDGSSGYSPNSTGVCTTPTPDNSGLTLFAQNPANYLAYQFYTFEDLQPRETYVLKLWDVDVAHSGKAASALGIGVYYCGGSVRLGSWIGADYFTNGHADYLELRFTPSLEGPAITSAGDAANNLANSSVVNATRKFINFYNSPGDATGTRNMTFARCTLEKESVYSSGLNLLGYSETYKDWKRDDTTHITFSNEVVDINVSGETANKFYRAYGYLTESDITSGVFVLSFEAYSDDWSAVTSDMAAGLASANVQVCYRDCDKWAAPSGVKRYLYGSLGQDRLWKVQPAQENSKWLRFESVPLYLPASFPADASKGIAREITVEPMLRRNGHVKFRHIKFERGTKASDWTPASEDVAAAIKAVPGFHYLNSAYTNPMATVQGWCVEGTDAGTWTVSSPPGTTGVKVGDTVYIKTFPSDNGSYPVYCIITVTSITGATTLRGISHGYVDARPGQSRAYQGTLSTGGGVAAKVGTCPGFVLVSGATVSLYCASSGHNVSGAMTLNVNGTGDIPIWVAGEATSDTNRLYWTYGCTLTFTYDGQQWRLIDKPPAFTTSTCSTAAGTAAKIATADSFVLFRGATYTVPMQNINTSTAATLQIQNSGSTKHPACPIYYGTSTTVPTKANGFGWPAGAAVIFTFDGKFWRTGNQTFIDGSNVVTGTVAADRIDVANINIGDLGGSMGGRNLLAYEDIYCYSSAQNAYLNKAAYITEGRVVYARTATKNEGFYITNSSKQVTGYRYTVHFDVSDTAKKVTQIYVFADAGKLIGGASSDIDVYIDDVYKGHGDAAIACDLTGGATKHITVKYTCGGASTSETYYGLILQMHKATAEAFNITVSNLKWERGGMETDWSPAESDVSAEIAAIEAAKGSYTILWNYSAFATSNNGEGYICRQDPRTHSITDANGTVVWNGVERTIPKGMINPDTKHPYNIPVYVVCRLSSASATTGTNYIVSYSSSKWQGGVINSGALSDWTWAEATDMIIGKFVESGSEVAFTDYEIYNPPLTSKQITTNTVTALGANSIASSASNSVAYYNRSCHVGNSSNTQTNYWRKFASYTDTATYHDPYIILDVLSSGDMDDNNRQGRLKAHLRTNGTVGTVAANQTKLEWIYRGNGMAATDFVMLYKATEGTDVKIELWCRCPDSWKGYRFYQVAEGDRINTATSAMWTLHDSWSTNGSASYTSGYTAVTSTDTSTPMITNLDQTGITIHPSDSDSNRVAIDSAGVELFKNNVSVAKYGETARIGRDKKARFEIGSSSLTAYNDSNGQYFSVSASGLSWGTNNVAAKISDIPTNVSDLTNDSGYQTSSQVNTIVTGKGYQTSSQVESAITGKGYQTSSQVESAITAKGYATTTYVNEGRTWHATCTSAADATAKVATITPATTGFSLKAGVFVTVNFSNTNTGAVGSLTLNVNSKGAKNIKYIASGGNVANLPAAGYIIGGRTYQFMYDGSYWIITQSYNTNNYDRTRYNQQVKAAANLAPYSVCVGTSSGYKTVAASVVFDISYPVLYLSQAKATDQTYAVASGGNTTNMYTSIPGVNLGDTATVQSVAVNKQVYLKGTLSGSSFTLASSNFITCAPSGNGTYYIPIGIVSNNSTSAVFFHPIEKIYAYSGGALQEFSFATLLTNNGLIVHKQGDPTTGVQITDHVGILRPVNNVATEVATFNESKIELGKNSQSSVIEMNGGKSKITARSETIGTINTTNTVLSGNGVVSMEWVADGTSTGQTKGQYSTISTWFSKGTHYKGECHLRAGDSTVFGEILIKSPTYETNAYFPNDPMIILGSFPESNPGSSTEHFGHVYTEYKYTQTPAAAPGYGIAPVSLYDNESAAFAGSIQLSETAANFSRLELFCKDNDGRYCYTQVYYPNNKTVNVTQTLSYGGNFYVKSRAFSITNKIINTASTSGTYHTGEVNAAGNNNGTSVDNIKIVKVLGYR